MDPVEILGFVSGALCVWLVARQNVWNWPIGIANNITFLILFWAAGIYADAGLQVVYLVLAVYGWWAWLRGGHQHSTLGVSRTATGQWVVLGVVGVAATAVLTFLLDSVTDSTVPLPDAATTVLSLLATWGQARKKLESWWLWIAADVIYVPLYAYKDLWLTAVLYVGFLALCVYGLRSWLTSLRLTELVPCPGGEGRLSVDPGGRWQGAGKPLVPGCTRAFRQRRQRPPGPRRNVPSSPGRGTRPRHPGRRPVGRRRRRSATPAGPGPVPSAVAPAPGTTATRPARHPSPG
ncbi:nicotinamide mononucleotide transporter PnuC [Actinophytocola oryzae]|uniref:Nicotinamide mononucleotide transporter PnuC n=1 Tax=Actinophytocola oryzae TaxID=502181 RepID=A0A4R7VHV7_9PSEU|nr:nicotinamide mononucleotide transporter PnuC [Actinophytocola oryzae]